VASHLSSSCSSVSNRLRLTRFPARHNCFFKVFRSRRREGLQQERKTPEPVLQVNREELLHHDKECTCFGRAQWCPPQPVPGCNPFRCGARQAVAHRVIRHRRTGAPGAENRAFREVEVLQCRGSSAAAATAQLQAKAHRAKQPAEMPDEGWRCTRSVVKHCKRGFCHGEYLGRSLPRLRARIDRLEPEVCQRIDTRSLRMPGKTRSLSIPVRFPRDAPSFSVYVICTTVNGSGMLRLRPPVDRRPRATSEMRPSFSHSTCASSTFRGNRLYRG
jgi:hypothetical protein